MESTQSQESILLRENRLKIDKLLDNFDYDGVADIEGITILARKEDIPNIVDCSTYVFGSEGIAEGRQRKEMLNIIQNGNETNNPKEGDHVIYFDDSGNFKHVGIYTSEGRVRSKFGRAHVYEHPIELVPTYYGDDIKVYSH